MKNAILRIVGLVLVAIPSPHVSAFTWNDLAAGPSQLPRRVTGICFSEPCQEGGGVFFTMGAPMNFGAWKLSFGRPDDVIAFHEKQNGAQKTELNVIVDGLICTNSVMGSVACRYKLNAPNNCFLQDDNGGPLAAVEVQIKCPVAIRFYDIGVLMIASPNVGGS